MNSEEAFALKAEKIRKTYQLPFHSLEVLRGVSLSIKQGEWVSLTGQSGCGKTTLLRILGALDKPDAGRLHCCGKEVTSMSSRQKARIRRLNIGFIFQNFQLFSELNALENVMLPGQLEGNSIKDIKERGKFLLQEVHVDGRLFHRPAELSGGEQQRVAIARALMNQPNILLADEPTGNLDDKNSLAIMKILQKLRGTENITIIMATHNQRLTEFADHIYKLEEGLFVE